MIRMVKWLIVCLVGGLFVLSSNPTAAAAQSQEKSTTVSGVIRDHWEVTGQNAQGQTNIGNTNAGYVGIGVTAPTSKLAIDGGGITVGGTPQRGIWNSHVPRTNMLSVVAADTVGVAGGGTSIALTIGPDGLPVVAYYATNQNLKVMKCGNVACSAGNTITTVDSVGSSPSITIGADDLPLIAYQDVTLGYLKVTHCGNSSCSAGNTTAFADSGGLYPSIALGINGLPIIAHSDGYNLRVLLCNSTSCGPGSYVQIIDYVGPFLYPSMSIGADGAPVISYYQATNGDLKVGKCGKTDCSFFNTSVIVDSTGDVGVGTSITLGEDGLPVVAYHDATNGDLKVAKCGDPGCNVSNTITVVDSAGVVGEEPSITLGPDGLPLIAYRDATNNDLKVAKCGNAACSAGNTITAVDVNAASPLDSAVAIGTDGVPVIAYRGTGGLFVAQCGNDRCLRYWTRR